MFGERANAVTPSLIWRSSCRVSESRSTPNDGATAWIAANCPMLLDPEVGSWRTATRLMVGAISLRSSSHFPLIPNSAVMNPVAFPPGRDRLWTKPEPTGPEVATNTTGVARLAVHPCWDWLWRAAHPAQALTALPHIGRYHSDYWPSDIRCVRYAQSTNQMPAVPVEMHRYGPAPPSYPLPDLPARRCAACVLAAAPELQAAKQQ